MKKFKDFLIKSTQVEVPNFMWVMVGFIFILLLAKVLF